MSQVNCYLVGGPKDGVTYVTDAKRDILQFDNEDPVTGDTFEATFPRHEYYAINYGGNRDGHQVYLHQKAKASAGIGPVLLQTAMSRHAERTLLHECASLLKACAVSPNTYATAHDRLSLIREIEEHLK